MATAKSKGGQKKGKEPIVSIETISPSRAKEMAKGRNFRNENPSDTDKYAEWMKNGQWVLNGESLIFDEEGNVLDGQHRLRACIKANVSFKTVVVRNIDTFEGIDEGRPRHLPQWLSYYKEKYVNPMATIIRAVHHMDIKNGKNPTPRDGFAVSPTNPKQQITCAGYLAYFQKDVEGFRRSVRQSSRCKSLIQNSVIGSLYYVFSKVDSKMAKDYIDVLSGKVLPETEKDPVYKLREILLNEKGLPDEKRSTKNKRSALCIKAWNFWCLDTEIERLTFRAVGGNAETFPEVLTPLKGC